MEKETKEMAPLCPAGEFSVKALLTAVEIAIEFSLAVRLVRYRYGRAAVIAL